MPPLPPIDQVPITAHCRECGHPFRGVVSFNERRPAYRRNRCPWCGTEQLLGRRLP